jgi:hypothetical protein
MEVGPAVRNAGPPHEGYKGVCCRVAKAAVIPTASSVTVNRRRYRSFTYLSRQPRTGDPPSGGQRIGRLLAGEPASNHSTTKL